MLIFMNLNENFGRALKNDEVLCRMENDTAGEKLVCLKNLNIKIGWWWLVDCGMQGTTRTDRLRMRIVTTISYYTHCVVRNKRRAKPPNFS